MTFTSIIKQSKKSVFFQLVSICVICLVLLTITVKDDTTGTNNDATQLKKDLAVEEREYPYTIITGSSANHLCSLENFLYSLNDIKSSVEPHQFPRIVLYNIGMNRTQLPILDQLQSNGLIDNVILFDHERYPQFWDVAVDAGQYAWKTGIVNDARVRYGGILVWLDAGDQVTTEFILNIPNIIRQDYQGFWSPKSTSSMGKWTHPGMFKFFGADAKYYKYKSNCNGAAIGFDTTNSTIVNNIIIPWFECGLQKNCIAPPGSSRANHRQDQAALTYLAYLHGHQCTEHPHNFNLQTHRDVACRANLMELDLQEKLHHPSAIDTPKWERANTLELYQHPEWKYPVDKVPVNIRRPQ